MREEWSVPAWAVLTLVVGLLVLAVVVITALAGALARTRADSAALRGRVEDVERRLAAAVDAPLAAPKPLPRADEHEYVITHLGAEPGPEPALAVVPPPAPAVEASLFADIVLRETVVQAASLAHGVRRALSPQNRNRIRFEMRREVKRARKQRRSDLRAAARRQREGSAA